MYDWVDSKSSQTSGIDEMETCDLGIPYLGLGSRVSVRAMVRVRLRVSMALIPGVCGDFKCTVRLCTIIRHLAIPC